MAPAAAKVAAGGRMSSMEREPKTLTLQEIKVAREAALYVVSTRTEEEAIRIFTEGLKPVHQVTPAARKCSFDSSSDDEVDLGSSDHASAARTCSRGKPRGRRRRRSAAVDDQRDVATAPF